MQHAISIVRNTARSRAASADHDLRMTLQPVRDMHQGHVLFHAATLTNGDSQTADPLCWGQFPLDAAIELACASLSLAAEQLAGNSTMRLCLSIPAYLQMSVKWVDRLQRIIAADPQMGPRFIFAIPEKEAALNRLQLQRYMRQLQASGACFALTDFGSGALAIKHLPQLFFDLAIIDDSFAANLAESTDQQLVVQALAGLAEQFEMLSVANGPEYAACHSLLADLGVDCVATTRADLVSLGQTGLALTA